MTLLQILEHNIYSYNFQITTFATISVGAYYYSALYEVCNILGTNNM